MCESLGGGREREMESEKEESAASFLGGSYQDKIINLCQVQEPGQGPVRIYSPQPEKEDRDRCHDR